MCTRLKTIDRQRYGAEQPFKYNVFFSIFMFGGGTSLSRFSLGVRGSCIVQLNHCSKLCFYMLILLSLYNAIASCRYFAAIVKPNFIRYLLRKLLLQYVRTIGLHQYISAYTSDHMVNPKDMQRMTYIVDAQYTRNPGK